MVATMIRWRVSSPLAPTGRPSCVRGTVGRVLTGMFRHPSNRGCSTDMVEYIRPINEFRHPWRCMTASPSQLGRPVGADSEETRRRIITAAMRCVAEVGYSQATIREIARAADMTSGSLYHYFPNKSELLKATVREIDEIALPRLRAAAERADDVIDRLEAVLDEADRLMREYPHLATFD